MAFPAGGGIVADLENPKPRDNPGGGARRYNPKPRSADPYEGADVSDLLAIVHNLQRLAVLERSGLLDSPPEEAFDRLTRLAMRLLRTPVALVSLVDRERQFFKSASGIAEPSPAPRWMSTSCP